MTPPNQPQHLFGLARKELIIIGLVAVFVCLGVEVGVGQLHFGDAILVIQRHGHIVFDRPAEVVDADVVAEVFVEVEEFGVEDEQVGTPGIQCPLAAFSLHYNRGAASARE